MIELLKRIINPNFINNVNLNKTQYRDWAIQNLKKDIKLDGYGEIAAVLDTGVDENHKDLYGRCNCVDFTQSKSLCKDENGHGTFCTSLICASDNNMGIVGIAPESHVVSCKVLDGDRTSVFDVENNLINAINYCVDGRIKTISISLGTPVYNKKLDEAIQNAIDHGTIIFAAFGNSGLLGEPEYLFPANYNRVISVGAANQKGLPFWFSSFSNKNPPTFCISSEQFYLGCLPNNRYGKANGTSMASPVAAGVCLLWRQFMRKNVGIPNDCSCYELFMQWIIKNTRPKNNKNHLGLGVLKLDKDSFSNV